MTSETKYLPFEEIEETSPTAQIIVTSWTSEEIISDDEATPLEKLPLPIEPPQWIPNTENCQICDLEFTLFTRPHHCRLCGRCICAECSESFLRIPTIVQYGNEKVRCCDECVTKYDFQIKQKMNK